MIDFLTAGEKRHSSRKAERKDMRSATSMKDYALRRKRHEARRKALAWHVVRRWGRSGTAGNRVVQVG